MTQLFTNVSNLPLALAAFLASDTYDYNPDPYTISATTLLKPVRQIILAGRLPPEVGMPDIMDQAATRIGAALHDGIERTWKHDERRTRALLALGLPAHVIERVRVNPTDEYVLANKDCIPVYMEQRLIRKIGKWTVTGKFDFAADLQVQDFKSANVLSYQKQRNADKQAWQGSIYRWLDANPGNIVRKITKDDMIIFHIFMDWMKGYVKQDPTYPPHRIMKQVIPLKSEQETENFVRNKLALIEQYADAPEAEIPECNDEELWRSEPVFKYYAKGFANQKRSTKNFTSRAEAYTFFAVDAQSKGELKEVPGLVKACHYCRSFEACTQKDRLLASGDLDMGQ